MTASAGAPVAATDELVFRLAGIHDRREADRDLISGLAARVDQQELSAAFGRYKLTGLLGARLVEMCPDQVEPWLSARVQGEIEKARRQHTLQVHFARRLATRFEELGIETLAIKGPLLAERIYDDPGLRKAAGDVDYVVRADRLDEAVEELKSLGYRVLDDTKWASGLPHYHYGLAPSRDYLPNVELHWRLHWYETRFAEVMIERSRIDGQGVRSPHPVDELAGLLLIYARDGFVGLRLPADVGAWWDTYGKDLTDGALDPVLEQNPKLRTPLLTALGVCEELVGIPSTALASSSWSLPARARLARRLVHWRAPGGWDRSAGGWESIATNITLIDLLLTPRGAGRVHLRHYYFQPIAVYARIYGWAPEARIRNQAKRAARAGVRMLKSAWKYTARLWALRGGARFEPLPRDRTRGTT